MWGAIIRFFASNLTGLAVGYSVRDIAGAVSGADNAAEKKEDESWLSKTIRNITGLSGWIAPAVGLALLVFLALRLGLIRRK